MQPSLNIVSIRVYKPKMVILKTVLFSLNISVKRCRHTILWSFADTAFFIIEGNTLYQQNIMTY